MDSFYDMPRKAPTPTNIEKCLIAPVVPEVSMICTSKDSATDYNAYNIWKSHQQESNMLTSNNRDNFKYSDRIPFPMNQQHFRGYQNSSQFLKKQVRFESPPLQQKPALTYEPFLRKKEVQTQNVSNSMKRCEETEKNLPVGTVNAFEQIYMANVPSRQLDLSIIDLPSFPKQMEQVHAADPHPEKLEVSSHDCDDAVQKNVNSNEDKENEMPKTYRDFLEMQKNSSKERYCPNDSVTDIFNYKKNVCTKTSEDAEILKSSNLCTNKLPICEKKLYKVNNMNNQKPSRNPLDESLLFMLTKRDCNDLADNEINEDELQKQRNKVVDDQHCLGFFQGTNISNQMSDSETQTSNFCSPPQPTETSISKVKDDSEPSTRDLLKIISQQNEQLLLLQSQVAMLLNREQNQKKQIEGIPQKVDYTGEKYVTSTQNEHFRQDNHCTPRKRGMSKFSIDLMTSFEVAIRPQHKPNFVNCEPKIQEITESDNVSSEKGSQMDKNEKNMYQSLHLREPVAVQETCPSPEPSININMNDYDSSDEEVSASEISATFYNNLMGQVNNILKKAQIQTRDDLVFKKEKRKVANAEQNNITLNKVKEATLKHLKNIGVTLGPMDDTDSSSSLEHDTGNYNPTEISFAVKQLLMKYLPDDHLAKISNKQEQATPINDKEAGIMTTRPEFSLASVQYMKKYNLISSEGFKGKLPVKGHTPWQNLPRQQMDNAKILDMTALKLQPKLL